jgi:superfamily II RNA helicase
MILNLLRVEDFRVEDMIKRSFSEFASQRLLPEQQKMLQKVENKLKSLGNHIITKNIFQVEKKLSKQVKH